MTKLIKLGALVKELGVSRHTMGWQAREGKIKVAGRTSLGHFLIDEHEADRLRELHRAGKLIKPHVRVGWPDEATYRRAWLARRKEAARVAALQAQQQTAQPGA